MDNTNFTVSFVVVQTAKEVFDAINNVSAWWTENIKGSSEQLNDEFEVRFGDVHYSKQKLIEVVPGKKVVWLVTGSQLNFLKDKNEWTGTTISFDITKQNNQTQVRFTHHGLVPGIECFDACSNAWSHYINDSLRSLLTTGTGRPEKKETAARDKNETAKY
jgi:hypothetical protein